jgi:fructose/tagatose bisphosphate aldolase
VSVGTVHGPYKGEPKLDFTRLEAIVSATNVPLVLHGASGLSASALQKGVALGVRKVNFSTELRVAWLTAMRRQLENPDADVLPCVRVAESAVKELVAEKIGILQG